MGNFSVVVNGLWCGGIFVLVIILADWLFPGHLGEMGLSNLGIVTIVLFLVFEMLLGYAKPPGG